MGKRRKNKHKAILKEVVKILSVRKKEGRMKMVKITEPTTAITDYILGMLTAYWGIRLLQQQTPATVFWGIGFISLAIASFLGGTAHGFKPALSKVTHAIIWRTTLATIGVTSATMVIGLTIARMTGILQTAIIAATSVLLVGYLILISFKDEFFYAIIGYTPSIIFVLIVEIMTLFGNNPSIEKTSAVWNLTAVIVSVISTTIQAKKIGISKNFNHNDLFHIVQMIGMYCFFRAGMLFS